MLRRTEQLLHGAIEEAAAVVRTALASGHRVTVCGNRISGAVVAAAGLGYDVFLPPGQAGDVLLVIMVGTPPDDLLGVIQAARDRGLIAIGLLTDESLALREVSDIVMCVPAADAGAARLAMVAVLRTINVLISPGLFLE